MSTDDCDVAEAKGKLRALGWYVRYTEWPSGHQVVLHRRSETAAHVVTSWCVSEVEAWGEALHLALEWRRGHHAEQEVGQHPQDAPG